MTLVGIDVATGAEAWRTQVPGAVPDQTGWTLDDGTTSWYSYGSRTPFAQVGPDAVAVASTEATTIVGADGGVLRRGPGMTTDETVDGWGSQMVRHGADGATLVLADADVPLPRLDIAVLTTDPTLSGLVLALHDGELGAYDHTGAQRWTHAAAGSQGDWIVLAGRVYLVDGHTLVALDGATGRELWVAEGRDLAAHTLATDGDVLLDVPAYGYTGTAEVRAYDLATGAERWRADLPDDVEYVYVVDGLLVGDEGVDEDALVTVTNPDGSVTVQQLEPSVLAVLG